MLHRWGRVYGGTHHPPKLEARPIGQLCPGRTWHPSQDNPKNNRAPRSFEIQRDSRSPGYGGRVVPSDQLEITMSLHHHQGQDGLRYGAQLLQCMQPLYCAWARLEARHTLLYCFIRILNSSDIACQRYPVMHSDVLRHPTCRQVRICMTTHAHMNTGQHQPRHKLLECL